MPGSPFGPGGPGGPGGHEFCGSHWQFEPGLINDATPAAGDGNANDGGAPVDGGT
jgi:hypothetical protein